MAESGYDPRRSKVSDSTMQNWRQHQITGDLTEVPGIGPATVQKLAKGDIDSDRITNTYMLFGKFLSLKGPNLINDTVADAKGEEVSCIEHMDKFWIYLKNKGISSHRSAIVKAVAEKAGTFFFGIYDENVYADDEDE